MLRRYGLAVFLFSLTLLVSGGAVMATEPDPARARALFVDAKRLHEEGRVREALVKLQEAYAAFTSDAILISIVNRHIDLDEYEEAAELLQHIDAPKGKLKRQVTRLQRQVDKALAKPVMVRLTADALGATVAIDDGEPMELPARVELPRGRYRFTFRAAGRSEVQLVEMLKGTVEIPIAASLPVPTGTWRVTIEPSLPLKEVRLLLDGQAVPLGKSEREKTVSEPRDVLPGAHRLTCLYGFEARADAEFTVESGGEAAVTCTFPDHGDSGTSPWAWITGGVGLAALATGVALLANYYDELPELQRLQNNSGLCSLGVTQTNFADCSAAGGTWESQYAIESNKPEFGWTFIGVGVGLGVTSGLFFADVLD